MPQCTAKTLKGVRCKKQCKTGGACAIHRKPKKASKKVSKKTTPKPTKSRKAPAKTTRKAQPAYPPSRKAQPAYAQPAYAQPAYAQPAYARPLSTDNTDQYINKILTVSLINSTTGVEIPSTSLTPSMMATIREAMLRRYPDLEMGAGKTGKAAVKVTSLPKGKFHVVIHGRELARNNEEFDIGSITVDGIRYIGNVRG